MARVFLSDSAYGYLKTKALGVSVYPDSVVLIVDVKQLFCIGIKADLIYYLSTWSDVSFIEIPKG